MLWYRYVSNDIEHLFENDRDDDCEYDEFVTR